MKLALHITAFAGFALFAGCVSDVTAISGTPTASQVLSNARQVTRQLESYRATVTTTETTVHLRIPGADSSKTSVKEIVVESETSYSVDQPRFDYQFVRSGDTGYTKSDGGDWVASAMSKNNFDLLPGEESQRPPEHPMEWLDHRYVVDTEYEGRATIDGEAVHVITGRIPMLPGNVSAELGIPHDDVWLYIDAETFQVMRIEIDQNILDSLREDSGYQVIPGVVEIDTREIIDYSDHNEEIAVEVPIAEPAV